MLVCHRGSESHSDLQVDHAALLAHLNNRLKIDFRWFRPQGRSQTLLSHGSGQDGPAHGEGQAMPPFVIFDERWIYDSAWARLGEMRGVTLRMLWV
ncbi:hypothetical protein GCM10012279_31450 [Micromonospora yangpuensis]|nr:hypothetical protein GCM10012279_31450 [Micromonospora yangpuensis]